MRDAGHSDRVRYTVWYPAQPDAKEQPLTIGPPGAPLFQEGSSAVDAPVAPGRWPLLLVSHGNGGSARMMGWFGTALARAGYVVVALDHPGNNGVDPMTDAGSILMWNRADDLAAALAAVQADPVLSPHVDAERLGWWAIRLVGSRRWWLPVRVRTWAGWSPSARLRRRMGSACRRPRIPR